MARIIKIASDKGHYGNSGSYGPFIISVGGGEYAF